MAKQKSAPLGDDEIVTKLDSKVKECVGWYDSRLSKERTRVTKSYNSELPRRTSEGSSSYISTDVYDAVEAMKAQLLETFSGNQDDLVSFPPQSAEDDEQSREATEACNAVIFRDNDGYGIIRDVIHDGLTARVGVAKVFWEVCVDHEDEEFDGLGPEELQQLVDAEDVPELEANIDEATGTASGTLQRRHDRSKVSIEPLPPEEFLISPRAKSIAQADCVAHRTLKTKSELKDMGFDSKKVDALHYDDSKALEIGPEVLSRNSPIESATADNNPIQPELEKVLMYEAYAKMDLKDGKGVRLYKVQYVSNTLLSKEEVDCKPFRAFVPLPIPHLFYGNNFAGRVVPTQNARTVLTRAVLDHAATTTNPRWTVVQGGLLNPKEMLDNRLGGLVNVKRPDAIAPLLQANLNPFVFQTIEMLKSNKEESTGISSLSQGLNKDAISTQNSAALVDNLVTLSQQRQKIIARNFAFGFLVPLYLEVYRLLQVNAKQDMQIEVNGKPKTVSPSGWCERPKLKVSLNLGYGERDRETAKYANTYGLLAKDPALAPMFKPKNRYNLITDGLKSAGFKNFSRYISTPEEIEPQQPDPLKVRELDIKDKTATAAQTTAQANQTKVQANAEFESIRVKLDELTKHIDTVFKAREADRQDADVENRIDIAQREMTLAEEAPEPNTIVSPNS